MPEISVGVGEVAQSNRTQLILDETLQNHASQMHESRANEQNVHNLARLSGQRKYDKEDPIEAANTDLILSLSN